MNLSFLKVPFRLAGDFLAARPHGNGHINDTFAAVYDQAGTRVRYLHQRINNRIFRNIPDLMENIHRVTTFTQDQLLNSGEQGASRRTLTLVEADNGKPWWIDASGHYWRTYLFIEGASTYDRARTPFQAREAAKAFGRFQRLLHGLPGERLHETIPDFHNTRSRFNRFEEAIANNCANRIATVRREIDWFRERESLSDRVVSAMERGEIPERISHNDTKLNNVMLDDQTMEGLCVIDLDTVMPGSALYDFGDLVRTAANAGSEDGSDGIRNILQLPMFEALTEGYLSAVAGFLTDREIDLLAFAGKLITFENGLRFITDYIDGDRYFKIQRPDQNLDRCRSQISLVESIEEHESRMESIIKNSLSSCGSS